MDFERARYNMVEQQIRPWDVLDQDVLDLLIRVRREDFVPAAYRTMAFTDMELPLTVDGSSTGEAMFAPKLEARLLQEAGVRRHETVVEVGTGSGYMAALLGHRARQVTTIEIHPALARFGAANLAKVQAGNVEVVTGDGAALLGGDGPSYDVIVLSGSVSFVPEPVLSRLNPGGRLIAIVGDEPVMTAQLVTRTVQGAFVTRNLFDTQVRRLTGFPVRERFRF